MDLLLFILSAIVFMIIMIFIVQFLWNYVMPEIFGLKEITFVQTLALIILINFLLAGHHCNTITYNYPSITGA